MSALATEIGLSGSAVGLIGLWLVIGGLLAEVAGVIFVHSLKWEKGITAACALIIALGVWLEHVGSQMESAGRTLSEKQQAAISLAVRQFPGIAFSITTYPDDPEPVALSEKIGKAVVDAGWEYVPLGGTFLGVVVGVFVTLNNTRAPTCRHPN